MSALVVAPMNDAPQWSPLQPDGVTPSAEVSIQNDSTIAGHGSDGVSGRIVATAASGGHSLRRPLAAVDLTAFTELRLSLRASTVADGGDHPFFLELRLGSAALPLSDPTNTWHRRLPVAEPGHWETVKLGIDDIPPAIAGATTQLELRCIGAAPFTAHVDDVTAVRPEMLADVDRALEQRLSGMSVGGTPVTVNVRAPSEAPPAAPALDLVNFDVRYATDRVRDAVETRDHTSGGGVRLVPIGTPYDLYYLLFPVAANRGMQTAIVEAVLERLEPYDELLVDGDLLALELVWIPGPERVGGFAGADQILFYKVGARLWEGAAQPAHEVAEIDIDAEYMEAT